jgi:hypothetical protein
MTCNKLWRFRTQIMRERYPRYAYVISLDTLHMRESVPSVCVEIYQFPHPKPWMTFAFRAPMYYIGLDIHKKTIDANRTQWRHRKAPPT